MKKIILIFTLLVSISISFGQLIINEVLYDPSNSALTGDANGDGAYDQEFDSFIEFLNNGAFPFDASGYQIWDDTTAGTLKYTIPIGTIIPPFGALVVFGGGTPTGSFGGAIVLTTSNADGLSLNNSGEVIVIRNALGVTVLTFDSDALSGNPNESYTRNLDFTGSFEQHSDNTPLLFSPGNNIAGLSFGVELSLTGILDFDFVGDGQGIHVTASADIADLSRYSLGIANNGGGTDGIEYSFPVMTVAAGDEIIVLRDSAAMAAYLGSCLLEFDYILVSGALNQNGNDAIELFKDHIVIETYGEVNLDGVGAPWEYGNSWGFKDSGVWTYGGVDCSVASVTTQSSSCPYPICPTIELFLTGILDFDLGGTGGKGIHLTASAAIADLSRYAFGIANNGGGTDGIEYQFPVISVAAGDEILVVRDAATLASYFGACLVEFDYVLIGNSDLNQNGDDAVELFKDNIVIETYGDVNVDGTGEAWEYADSWAYKSAGVWIYGGPGCSDGSLTTQSSSCPYPICTPCTQNEWTAATDNDWADPTNWSCGVVPSNACGGGSDNALIPSTTVVIPVVSGTQGVGNLDIATSASIIINGVLQACGDITHNGNPITGAGNFELSGSSTQTLNGNGVYTNLTLANSLGALVAISANLGVSNSLALTLGTFTNAGTLSLLSDALGTAYLDDFSLGFTGTYSGDITMERYVTPGVGLGQRYFGSAVNNGVVSGLDGTYAGYPLGQIIPLACDPNELASSSPYSNLFEWNENTTFSTACSQEGWFAISASAPLSNARGYSGWMNDGSTLEVTGTPNTGSQSYGPLSNTNGLLNADGWHLLSNPFPSPMNVDAITADGFNSPQYYNAASGAFSGTFQPALVAGAEVPIMQGLVARTLGANSFAPDNSSRVASNNPNFNKSTAWFDYRLNIELSVNGNSDITYVYFSADNTAQFDLIGDCVKRHSDIDKPTLFTKLENQELSLNGFNLNDLGTSIPMGLIAPVNGTYTFSFDGMIDFPANTTIYIEDKLMDEYHELSNCSYTFNVDVSENGTDRFMIHFVLPASFTKNNPSCENNLGSIVDLTMDDRNFELSNESTVIEIGTLNGSIINLPHGEYNMEVFDQFGGSQSYGISLEQVISVEAAIDASTANLYVGESASFSYLGQGANNFEWYIGNQLLAETEMLSYTFATSGVYTLELRAQSSTCEAIATRDITVNEKTTSIFQLASNSAVQMFAFNGAVILDFVNIEASTARLEVYNLLGQNLYANTTKPVGKQTISIPNINEGYYIIRLFIDQEVFTSTVFLNSSK